MDEIYASGSFAIHTATLSKVKRDQHDVDAVLELLIPQDTNPKGVIDTLYKAIRGDPGSQYYGYSIVRNSRCVTVTYPDGVTVDLMPVVRLAGEPDRAAVLFHHKPGATESYHKRVNPKAFANFFNAHVEVSEEFASAFESRRLLSAGSSLQALDERADTQPMPDLLPLESKSPRIVALQLMKRYRDLRYRSTSRKDLRKPPSVVLAALSLQSGPASQSLLDELINLSTFIRNQILAAEYARETLHVCNPAYRADVFTDRWPEDREAQKLWSGDLSHLLRSLHALRQQRFDPEETQKELAELFGETAANYAIDEHFKTQSKLTRAGQIGVSGTGSIAISGVSRAAGIVSGGAATSSLILPARANTNMGGFVDGQNDRTSD